ncbi:MAG: hypothetical protein ABI794_10970 [Betaproteobacteria bacterium]
MSPYREYGVSLAEIALILVILSLTAGAVLKGQELIFSARAKAIIGQTEQARLGFLGFQDRFRGLPGDYRDAPSNIPRVLYNGNGDGRIESGVTPVGANGVADEDSIVWDHLSKAGFLSGSYDYSPGNPLAAIPRNIFGGCVGLLADNDYGDPSAPPPVSRHLIKTGSRIPVEYLAEMDTKIDDGNALKGGFQFSTDGYCSPAPLGPTSPAGCTDSGGNWRVGATPRPVNCGGASLL